MTIETRRWRDAKAWADHPNRAGEWRPPITEPDCPQCGETSCDCVPLCLDRYDRPDELTMICELPPNHDGMHRDGTITWFDDDHNR